jgi:hypothetical protein
MSTHRCCCCRQRFCARSSTKRAQRHAAVHRAEQRDCLHQHARCVRCRCWFDDGSLFHMLPMAHPRELTAAPLLAPSQLNLSSSHPMQAPLAVSVPRSLLPLLCSSLLQRCDSCAVRLALRQKKGANAFVGAALVVTTRFHRTGINQFAATGISNTQVGRQGAGWTRGIAQAQEGEESNEHSHWHHGQHTRRHKQALPTFFFFEQQLLPSNLDTASAPFVVPRSCLQKFAKRTTKSRDTDHLYDAKKRGPGQSRGGSPPATGLQGTGQRGRTGHWSKRVFLRTRAVPWKRRAARRVRLAAAVNGCKRRRRNSQR